jgi:hypothetical protein
MSTTVSGFRFSLQLDAQTGPASRISRARATNIVSAAMLREPKSRVDLKRPPRRRPWHKVALLAAAALVLPVTVVAGAVRLAAIRHVAPAPLFVARPTPAVRAEPKPASQAIEAPAALVDEAPVPIETPAVVAVPRTPETPRLPSQQRPCGCRGSEPTGHAAERDDLRAQHQWLAATQVYEKMLAHSRSSRSHSAWSLPACSAPISSAIPRARFCCSPRASARPRALAEEARWGAIQAFRALGDRRRKGGPSS